VKVFSGMTEGNGGEDVSSGTKMFESRRATDPLRVTTTTPIDLRSTSEQDPASAARAADSVLTELRALMARARGGGERALPSLRALLDAEPGVLGDFGDVAAHAQADWIQAISGRDRGLAEALERQIAALKTELVGPTPTPVERVLLRVVIVTWLNYYKAESAAAALVRDGETEPESKRSQEALGGAHRRHLLSLKALTDYQRLSARARAVGATEGAATPYATGTEIVARSGSDAPPRSTAAQRSSSTQERPVNLGLFPHTLVSKTVARGGKTIVTTTSRPVPGPARGRSDS
jgi:hypothetical protein